MRDQGAPRARRVPVVADEPLIGGDRYDYADAFEIRVREPDARTAEQFARCALEQAPWLVRWTVWIAHRHLLRVRLGPRSSPDHVLWLEDPDVPARRDPSRSGVAATGARCHRGAKSRSDLRGDHSSRSVRRRDQP